MNASIVDSYGKTWVVVLAGGEGSRLRSLTTTSSGVAVPKQYCSLWGDASLFEHALIRGAAVAPLRKTCAVVAAPHRRWWSTVLANLPQENVIVQPQDRGTGIGILLSLLSILKRDPGANVVLLPADHYLQEEAIMAISLRRAADLGVADPRGVYLLGAESSEADPDLGYVVPFEQRREGFSGVSRFVEKPSRAEASELLKQGALLNVFVMAGSAVALLKLYDKSHSNAALALDNALARPSQALTRSAISDLYEHLSPIDFSRDILAGQEAALSVVPVAQCGWSDLGTPERVAKVLQSSDRQPRVPASHVGGFHLSLARQSLARA
jgi:mannose-1-phosphate guanylyltransferase